MSTKRETYENGELLSVPHLREPIRALLGARDAGLGEAMLVQLVRTPDVPFHLGRVAPGMSVASGDKWLRVVRNTCRAVGASRSPEGVWSMPA
jgi:hypothetical protein